MAATSYDHVHPCPGCGSAWRVHVVSVVAGGSGTDVIQYRAATSSGSCSNPNCSLSSTELAAFRETRRRLGWDRWLTRTG